MIQPITFYQDQIDQLQQRISKLNKEMRWLSIARLAAFMMMIASLFIWKLSATSWIVSGISFICLLVLVKWHGKKSDNRKAQKIKQSFFSEQLFALTKWDFTGFSTGNSYKNGAHPYSSDINVFGSHSLFQFISRNHPLFGEKILAEELTKLSGQKDDLVKKQVAVKEMKGKIEFMDSMYLNLRTEAIDESKMESLNDWMQIENAKAKLTLWKVKAFIQIVIFIVSLGGILSFQLPSSLLLIPAASMVILLSSTLRKTNVLLNKSDKLSAYLQQLQHTFIQIESEPFQSELLLNLQHKLSSNGVASQRIHGLIKAFQMLEYRQNIIVGILLNTICLWDIWALLKISKIKHQIHDNLFEWIETVASFDHYASLGRFAFDHPNAIYPTVENESKFWIQAEELGHPFIHETKRVCNNFHLKQGDIFIITGANMAGKSTFLRTLGVTVLLSNLGLPVFAKSCSMAPFKLFSSMLAADDLSEEKSYFLAEVDRLATLLKYRNLYPNTLLILDEILKGTNSHDKELGSKLFIEKLIAEKATGIIATHDLNLTKMSESFPEIHNFCFEVEHTKEKMIFDYKLRSGATQNMNAMRLLSQKGLINTQEDF